MDPSFPQWGYLFFFFLNFPGWLECILSIFSSFPSLSGIPLSTGVVLMQDHQVGKVREVSFSEWGKHSMEKQLERERGGKCLGKLLFSCAIRKAPWWSWLPSVMSHTSYCNPECTQPMGGVRQKAGKAKRKKGNHLIYFLRCFSGEWCTL